MRVNRPTPDQVRRTLLVLGAVCRAVAEAMDERPARSTPLSSRKAATLQVRSKRS